MEKNGRFHWGNGSFARVVRLPSVNNSPSGSCESLTDDFDQLLSLDRTRSSYFADYSNSPESFRRSLQQLEEYRKISHFGYNTGQCFNMSSSISSDCDDWCTVDLVSPVEQQKFLVWPPPNRACPSQQEFVELSKPDLLAISEQTRQMERRNEELRQEQLMHQDGRGCFQPVNSCLLGSASLNSNVNTSSRRLANCEEKQHFDKNSPFSKRTSFTHTHC
ncbi:hypothetical protein T4D_12487 [Trichinella pseudospiralis]|uniref:Uncharacterized protein n=1 Tax=Trichinella pseudospiralis TaxID=6337 RepID=A0A0V1FN22_TRIPS|nr:hypothetical protein T4D_12487 [Trichinella pseudospiralis]